MRISEHIRQAEKVLAELDDPAVTHPLVGVLHVLLAQAKIERARLRRDLRGDRWGGQHRPGSI